MIRKDFSGLSSRSEVFKHPNQHLQLRHNSQWSQQAPQPKRLSPSIVKPLETREVLQTSEPKAESKMEAKTEPKVEMIDYSREIENQEYQTVNHLINTTL